MDTFIKKNFKSKDLVDIGAPQKAIIEWADKNNVPVIDLMPELAKKNQNNDFYWQFNPHFNIKGNQEVAQVLYTQLKTKI